MSDIKKHAVAGIGRLQLRDATDLPLFADDDKAKPMAVVLFGPGSKEYAKAKANRDNSLTDAVRRKGKNGQFSAEEIREHQADFLADCTKAWENVEYEDKKDRELSVAIYSDVSIGFLADQVSKFLGDWGNFTSGSTTT